MDDVISAPLFAGGLFLGMLACLELGRREYPRLGFIRGDVHDQVMAEVLEGMR